MKIILRGTIILLAFVLTYNGLFAIEKNTTFSSKNICAVIKDDSLTSKDWMFSIGAGIKFIPFQDSRFKSYPYHSVGFEISSGFSTFLTPSHKSLIGFELYIYSDPDTGERLKGNSVGYFLDVYYRLNINLTDKLTIFPQLGATPLFSSVPALSYSITLGAAYKMKESELFIKNCIKIIPASGSEAPWFLSAGCSFYL